MIPRRGGAIVSILAMIRNGFPGMAHTGAARAGVDNLTKSLAVEWSTAGVRVNAIAAGIIDSGGLETYDEAFQELLASSRHHIPMGRLGTPREIAAAVVFLLSPAASFITGETLRVDGGEPLLGSSAARTIDALTGERDPTAITPYD